MQRELKQAWVIIRSAWQRNLNYRMTVITYRIGEIAELLVLILMWTAIYASGSGVIKGFTLNEMITYVLMGNLCSVAVRNFLSSFVARDIVDGRLSMYLVKPISYIKFVFINELGRSFLQISLSVLSQVCVLLFFLDKFIFNSDMRYTLLVIAMVFFSAIIELLMGFLIGSIGFWTDEVDGIETSIGRIKKFFSGGYFPLSLLPIALSTLSFYLPFAYSFFVPAQLYLKKIDLYQGVWGLGVEILWIMILSGIVNLVWKAGLKRYEASGS